MHPVHHAMMLRHNHSSELHLTGTWFLASVNIVAGNKAVTGAKEKGEDKQVSGRAQRSHGWRLRGRQLKWLILLMQWIFHRKLADNVWLMILWGDPCVYTPKFPSNFEEKPICVCFVGKLRASERASSVCPSQDSTTDNSTHYTHRFSWN
jgi:hypothetical protein